MLLIVKGSGTHAVLRRQGRCPGRHMSQSVPGEEDREEQSGPTGTCKGPEVGLGICGLEGS